ncbi:unnamed protein product [Coregonus sp. 'balchen']|nr:unnamed protein product [Coregonus sp. 'balchen']
MGVWAGQRMPPSALRAPRTGCEEENGGCEHFCQNADTHYYCECSEGFTLAEDGQTCQPNHSCGTANYSSSCEHRCENTPSSFACHCHHGFTELPDESGLCQDINECETSTSCHQKCLNYVGGFECYCYLVLPNHLLGPRIPRLGYDTTALEWLTERTSLERLPTDLGWFTEAPQEKTTSSRFLTGRRIKKTQTP